MKILNSKEDFEILLRLSKCLIDTMNLIYVYSNLDPEIIEISDIANKISIDIGRLHYRLLKFFEYEEMLNHTYFDIYISNIISDQYKELETINEKIYQYIDKCKISHIFHEFQKCNTHALIDYGNEKSEYNIII